MRCCARIIPRAVGGKILELQSAVSLAPELQTLFGRSSIQFPVLAYGIPRIVCYTDCALSEVEHSQINCFWVLVCGLSNTSEGQRVSLFLDLDVRTAA